MGVIMLHKNFLDNVKILIQMHSDGFLGGELMPEDVLIGIVPDDELNGCPYSCNGSKLPKKFI